MKFTKKLIAGLGALTLVVQTLPIAQFSATAETIDNKNYVTVLVDKTILGQGYVVEPTLVEYQDGDTAGTITERIFDELGIEIEGSYSYISGIKNADNGDTTFPEWLLSNSSFSYTANADSNLSAFDYNSMSGWMYWVNDTSANVGCSSYEIINDSSITDGDITQQANLSDGNVVIRWAFTAYGYGADLGYDGWGGNAMVDVSDKTDLYSAMAYANYYGYNGSDYTNAYNIAIDFKSTETEISNATTQLETSTQNYIDGKTVELEYSIDELEDGVSNYLLDTVTTPTVGSVSGEWAVLQLARSGNITDTFKNAYLENLDTYLEDCNGVLSTSKSTDYSRVIIALSSLGCDASDYNGYDLIAPLSDYDFTIKQGLNGAIYGLIALDTCNYEIPTCEDGLTQNSCEKLIDYTLSKQLTDGGWAFFGSTYDVDMTSMTIQALAPYYNTNADVKTAIDKAIDLLGSVQLDNGGYSSWGSENPCSTTQVLCALASVGIDPATDKRFITADGDWIVSNLMNYTVVDSANNISFKYQLTDNASNQMTTEQIGYSLTAYNRLLNNQTSLYDCSDLKVSEETTVLTEETTSADTTVSTEEITSADTTVSTDETTSADTTVSTGETTSADTTVSTGETTSADTTVSTGETTSADTTVSTGETTSVDTTSSDVITVTILGDINGDGKVKSNDLLALKKYLLGLIDMDTQAKLNADVNKDGNVKSNDLLMLKKYLLGILDINA